MSQGGSSSFALAPPAGGSGAIPNPNQAASNLPIPPRNASHPQQPSSTPTPTPNPKAAFALYTTELRRHITKNWVPGPLSPEEVDEIRRDTASRIQVLRQLEMALDTATPETDEKRRWQLLMARMDFRYRFYRIFRINDLPDEILTNIFRYISWSAPDRGAGVRWRLWLTWTCRHWRKIALQDPTLWSAIWFRDPPPFERSIAWFDRAGSAPLDLRIGDHENHTFTDEEMGALLDKLFTKISNIRMFIATIKEWAPVLLVLDKFRSMGLSGIPINLERFELHRTGTPYVQIGAGYQPSSFREPMALFGGVQVPSLKYFSVNGVHLDWKNSVLTNLTTLDLRRMPLELSPGILQFRDMLSSSPALRKLCLDAAGPRFQVEEGRGLPPVELDQLKILVIADFSVHYAHYVLAHISARNVRDLTLLNLGGEDYSPFFTLITPRFPEVRILTVYSVEVVESVTSGRAMVKWLDSMPHLAYLRIANIKKLFLELFLYDPQTFQHVQQTQSANRMTLSPKLSFLECQAVDPDMIAGWGLARRQMGAPLSKIYVTQEWAKKITGQQYAAFTKVAPLFILEKGKPVEEDALMN